LSAGENERLNKGFKKWGKWGKWNHNPSHRNRVFGPMCHVVCIFGQCGGHFVNGAAAAATMIAMQNMVEGWTMGGGFGIVNVRGRCLVHGMPSQQQRQHSTTTAIVASSNDNHTSSAMFPFPFCLLLGQTTTSSLSLL